MYEPYRLILQELADGHIDVAEAARRLGGAPLSVTPELRLDLHRALRIGIPETVFGQGKTLSQIEQAVDRLSRSDAGVLVSRLEPEIASRLQELHPDGTWHRAARMFEIAPAKAIEERGQITILTAGTSDLPVAAEAAVTARVCGTRVTEIHDAGVAGIHRLLDVRGQLEASSVVVVVAGMDGALPSVVGGLVSATVIAVPTSVGYGASFGGVAALLTMLNSCAPGVLVCNIDNGYGAGIAAARIARAEGIQPHGKRAR
jgi:NCAIR mutase (PurE)-related protein